MPCVEEIYADVSVAAPPDSPRLMMEEERSRKASGANGEVCSVRVRATTTEGIVKERASRFAAKRSQSRSSEDDADSAVSLSRLSSVSPPSRPDTPKIIDLESEPRSPTYTTAVIETPPHQKNVSFEKEAVQTSAPVSRNESGALPARDGTPLVTLLEEPLVTLGDEPKARTPPATGDGDGEGDEEPLVARQKAPEKLGASPSPDPSHHPPAPDTQPQQKAPDQAEDPSCIVDCLYFGMQCCECTIM